MKFEVISAGELDRCVENGQGLVIDLRLPEEYRAGHIRGAVNLPYQKGMPHIPRNASRDLILYCERGSLSMAAARELADRNYRVKTVVGGIHAYRGPYLVKGGHTAGRK